MRRGWGGGGVAILLFAALLPFRTLSFSSPAPLGGPTQLHAVERCAYEALRGPCGVSAGDRLLVLASGGSDSTALILIMARLAPCFDPPLDLRVASFDHRLRHDSNHDSSFVSTTARSLGLPCVVRSWECPEQAIAAQGVAVQDLARKWRMAQAEELLDDMNASLMVTAHQQDDQDETMVLKFLRGVHVSNFAGMSWAVDVQTATPGGKIPKKLLRPLLGVTKAELVEYLNERNQVWREDPTNASEKYKRNKVRLQLLPMLRDFCGGSGGFHARITDLARQSALVREMVEMNALQWEKLHLDLERPLELPVAPLHAEGMAVLVQEELIHRFLVRMTGGGAHAYHQTKEILSRLAVNPVDGSHSDIWSLHLEGGVVVERIGDVLRGGALQAGGSPERARAVVHAAGVAISSPAAWRAAACRVRKGAPMAGMLLYNVHPGDEIILRARVDGDAMDSVGSRSRLMVKDALRHRRVPPHRRSEVAVVCLRCQHKEAREIVIGLYPGLLSARVKHDQTGGEVLPLQLTVEASGMSLLPVLR